MARPKGKALEPNETLVIKDWYIPSNFKNQKEFAKSMKVSISTIESALRGNPVTPLLCLELRKIAQREMRQYPNLVMQLQY